MTDLNPRESELVALGAAMGSNCVPCVEHHISEARRVGLTEPQIHAAIRHADMIRQVPARKTLEAALRLLPSAGDVRDAGTAGGCGCGAAAEPAKAEAGKTSPPRDMLMGMMSKMMAACGGHGRSAGAPNSEETEPPGHSARHEGCA